MRNHGPLASGHWPLASSRQRSAIGMGVLLAVLLLLAGAALAQSGAFDLAWWSVDGGGGMWSAGGGFTLGGAVGQPDAGVLSGGEYTLSGGFWGVGGMYIGYLPVVMK